jgi:L-asparagine transporter-like permease
MSQGNITKLRYSIPFYPYSNYLVFAAVLLIFVTLAFDKRTKTLALGYPI